MSSLVVAAKLIPNADTIEAMKKEARRGDLPQFDSVEDLFHDLRADDLIGSSGIGALMPSAP